MKKYLEFINENDSNRRSHNGEHLTVIYNYIMKNLKMYGEVFCDTNPNISTWPYHEDNNINPKHNVSIRINTRSTMSKNKINELISNIKHKIQINDLFDIKEFIGPPPIVPTHILITFNLENVYNNPSMKNVLKSVDTINKFNL